MIFCGHQYSSAVKAAGGLGAFVLLVAIGCHILCLATPFFFILPANEAMAIVKGHSSAVPSDYKFGLRYGLWLICVDGGNSTSQDQCHHMQSNSSADRLHVPEWLVAARVLSLVGLLLASAAVVSVVAFVMSTLEKLPNLFLASAAVTSVLGGIIILSSDITFAAKKTIRFYADKPQDSFLFPKNLTDVQKAYLLLQYDNSIISGWSFILDLISGALCIVVGPIFVFLVIKLQWAKERADRAESEKHHTFPIGGAQLTSL